MEYNPSWRCDKCTYFRVTNYGEKNVSICVCNPPQCLIDNSGIKTRFPVVQAAGPACGLYSENLKY